MTKFIQTNIVVMILFAVAMLNTNAIRFTLLGYAVILALYLVVNLICYVVLVDQKVKA
jgi:cellulose synthase/poly-beta-1,6-N-acetylglucosamine synthase-like glycosyltransferase